MNLYCSKPFVTWQLFYFRGYSGVPNGTAPQNMRSSGYSWAGWQIFHRRNKSCWEFNVSESLLGSVTDLTLWLAWQMVTYCGWQTTGCHAACSCCFITSDIFRLFLFRFAVNLKTQNGRRSIITVWAVLGGWPFCNSTNYWPQNWKTWSALYISAVFER